MTDRSAEDREAARLERARRRAGREARFEPTADSNGTAAQDQESAAEPDGALGDKIGPGDSDHTLEHDLGPERDGDGDLDGDLGGDLDGDLDDDASVHETASGTTRISHLDKRARGAKTRSARGARPRRPAGKRHSWTIRLASLIPVAAAIAAIWFAVELFQPFGTSPHGEVTVVIPPHSTSKQIGNLLAHDGVIASSFFFELRATLDGVRGDLRSGTYHFRHDMSYGSVLGALTKAPPAAKVTALTIAEGHTRQYIAKLLHDQHISGNYVAATRASKLLDPHAYGAPRHVPSLEGFMFPDTFELVQPATVKALVADQLRDFKRRFATVNLSYARSKHLSPYDVLKIASLVEGEAASARDRPLVASVIYNRLHDHMELQLDSTTRYATGNFTKPLTPSELRSPSPYNTRNHLGLPPTPIDNPGVAAIDAAAHPAKTKYLYFFAKPCTDRSVFATSYAQFLTLLARDKRTHC